MTEKTKTNPVRIHVQLAVNARLATDNYETFNAQVEAIRENHGFISIRGYVSESGRVANLVVQPLSSDGYPRLIRESLEQVKAGNVTRPDYLSQEVWEKAIGKRIASWEKTLDGGHGRKNNYTEKKKGFHNHADAGETLYIRNVRVISKNVIKEGEYKPDTRGDIAKARMAIEKQCPIDSYKGTFKLLPEKFECIRFQGETLVSPAE